MKLDCDGGASHGARGGATVVTGATATEATVPGGATIGPPSKFVVVTTVALGGGAIMDLHPVRAVRQFKCCKCECGRFPGC